jgi:hypothetical protein
LKDARLGIVRSLFGANPEDQEVTTVVNRMLEALKKAGAEPIDVVIPGLDELLRDSSVINAEFKFDFAEYLARHPEAPVKSLGEILDRGLYHAGLEGTFKTRNAVETRGTEQERRARIKRVAIREAVVSAMEEHRLVALVYPTLRRKPARIGDAQVGSNCQLSASSGLPALAVPAGFSDDGLPVGVDLLGRPWSEADLLSLGYAMEQTLTLRRAPFSTPALVNGKAPPAKTVSVALEEDGDRLAVADFTYDQTTGRLAYKLLFAPRREQQVSAIWIHRSNGDKPAAAVYPLFAGEGSNLPGAVVLASVDRASFVAGRLRVRVYTRRHPAGIDVALAENWKPIARRGNRESGSRKPVAGSG